jgi:hypothetical protein
MYDMLISLGLRLHVNMLLGWEELAVWGKLGSNARSKSVSHIGRMSRNFLFDFKNGTIVHPSHPFATLSNFIVSLRVRLPINWR